jgi:hypothetical protein
MKAALALLAAAPLVLAQPATDPSQEGHTAAAQPDERVCQDRIRTVREERGLPTLDRRTASPDQPYLIAAVDHRIEGCSVMVMRHDTSDVRPLPANPERAAALIPAR